MRNLLLSIAFIFSFLTLSAQDIATSKLRLHSSIGAAFTTGNFGKIGLGHEVGSAKTGVSTSIGITWDVNPYLGLGLTLASRLNAVNVAKLSQQQTEEKGAQTEITGSYHSAAYITTDVYGQLPVQNFTFYAKGSLGYGRFLAPELTVVTTGSDGDKTTSYLPEGKGFGVVYGVASGARYNMGKFSFGLELGYLAANPEMDFDSPSEATAFKRKMNTINSTMTLGYRIN